MRHLAELLTLFVLCLMAFLCIAILTAPDETETRARDVYDVEADLFPTHDERGEFYVGGAR